MGLTGLDIYKHLPKTNCKECGQPTCIVFASFVIQGVKDAQDCLQITEGKRQLLDEYINRFSFPDFL